MTKVTAEIPLGAHTRQCVWQKDCCVQLSLSSLLLGRRDAFQSHLHLCKFNNENWDLSMHEGLFNKQAVPERQNRNFQDESDPYFTVWESLKKPTKCASRHIIHLILSSSLVPMCKELHSKQIGNLFWRSSEVKVYELKMTGLTESYLPLFTPRLCEGKEVTHTHWHQPMGWINLWGE